MNQGRNVFEMKRMLTVVLSAMAFCVAAAPSAKPWMKGTTDKSPLEYGTGETMTFTLTLERAQSLPKGLEIVWERTGDDGKKETGKAPADPGKPLVIKTSLDRPGFVRIHAIVSNPDGTPWSPDGKPLKKGRPGGYPGGVYFDGGAGVDVDAIRQAVPPPADFEDFWKRHKATLAAVSMNGAKCEAVVSSNTKVKIYMVSVPCAGPKPATGYLIVPVKEGRYPARMSFHGYGASWGKKAWSVPDCKRENGDTLHLILSAHGFELNRESSYYSAERRKAMSNGHTHGFDPKQNSDPETAYFCGMTYRVMRGAEYLKSRPEWNGKDFIVTGASQGGLQAIWAAALVPGVTSAMVQIPWCCDIGGTSIGRNHGEWYVQWMPALGYYDPVNMARMIPKSCTVDITSAGLGDYTCPPTGVATFYNNLTCPKGIVWLQGATHGYRPPNPEKIQISAP